MLRDPEENPEAFTAGLLQFLVQWRVLPKPPTLPGLELAAAMQTAGLLGGDYFDLFQISDDVVDVAIAERLRQGGRGISSDALAGGGPTPPRSAGKRTAAIIKEISTKY